MRELIEYLNSLPMEKRQAFAKQCGTSEGYMRKAASVGDCLNPMVCSAVERLTCGAVTRQSLRPQDYWLIWPDLKAPKAKE